MNILLEIDIPMVYFWKRKCQIKVHGRQFNSPPNPIIIGQRWYFYCVIWGNFKSKEYKHLTCSQLHERCYANKDFILACLTKWRDFIAYFVEIPDCKYIMHYINMRKLHFTRCHAMTFNFKVISV